MNPLVSIIIPTYNRAHLIGETLDSVMAQTYQNWECIIVDDGSEDDTLAVLERYLIADTRFQFHYRPIDRIKGANSCRNYGFELSKGEYIKWFDSDDIMFSDCLEKQIENSHTFDVSVCQVVKYDFENQKILGMTQINSDQLILDYLLGKITFYIISPLWKKEFVKRQKGLFDESISNLDDWDFNLRMLYENPVIKFINEGLIYYRIHNESLSQELGKLNRKEIASELKARDKHIKLLERNNDVINSNALQNFTKNRVKYFLREALVRKDANDLFLCKELFKRQIKLFDFIDLFKSVFAVTTFKIFGKGYKYL
ncbi:glycosyltransferase family 2 protein [Flavobacterium daejeonense]|uniref:glycosyltransferase family 2 protein n=1 Tax=Flavobacterium daejeonense TaxID=350893 RepID=UPI00047A00D0|nr:glycosyltransferase [Flavobacterium daejeonense]